MQKNTFYRKYEKADRKTRKELYELRSTWEGVFSRTRLYNLDVLIQSLDPTWPIIKPIITQDEKSNLNTETMENKRRFNRAIKVGNDIKRNNKGMYAMDTFEQMNTARIMDNSSRTYAGVVKSKGNTNKSYVQCTGEMQGIGEMTSGMQMFQMTGGKQGIGEMTSGMRMLQHTGETNNTKAIAIAKAKAIPDAKGNLNRKAKAKSIAIAENKKTYKVNDIEKSDKSHDKSNLTKENPIRIDGPNTRSRTKAKEIIETKTKAIAKEKCNWLHRKDLLRPP